MARPFTATNGNSGRGCMDQDRTEHLSQLIRDIQKWKLDVERLEANGETEKAFKIKGWIESAQRLAERLKTSKV